MLVVGQKNHEEQYNRRHEHNEQYDERRKNGSNDKMNGTTS